MATHSSTFAWQIPRTEEPGRLQSMGSRRVGHDWETSLSLFTFMHWRRKWQHTRVLAWRIPGMGEPGGLPSMGSYRVRHDWSDLTTAAAVTFKSFQIMTCHLVHRGSGCPRPVAWRSLLLFRYSAEPDPTRILCSLEKKSICILIKLWFLICLRLMSFICFTCSYHLLLSGIACWKLTLTCCFFFGLPQMYWSAQG